MSMFQLEMQTVQYEVQSCETDGELEMMVLPFPGWCSPILGTLGCELFITSWFDEII